MSWPTSYSDFLPCFTNTLDGISTLFVNQLSTKTASEAAEGKIHVAECPTC